MEMQVSLSHNHAHHGSMCTDGRTRVGGEEATARRSRRRDTLVHPMASNKQSDQEKADHSEAFVSMQL